MQPESRLVKKIRSWIESEGGVVFKIHGGDNPFQEAGIPDLLCCWYGRFVGIEVKAPGRRGGFSKLQVRNLERIEDAGGIGIGTSSLTYVKMRLSEIVKED